MRRKKSSRHRRNRLFALMLVLLIALAYGFIDRTRPPALLSATPQHHLSGTRQNPGLSDVALYSPHAILVRLRDRQVLMEARSDERIYPASLTKILTAIVAIEQISDLSAKVRLSEEIFPGLRAANASVAGFSPGESVSAIDLVYGALLPSGADAALGLAVQVAGTESEFVALMNQKADELGMDQSHFTNATGLHDDEHYTTVMDIAVLLEYALRNDTFREVFTAARHVVDSSKQHPQGLTFYSTMFAKMGTREFTGGKILGGKTGYTEESGLCLASLAEKGGSEYILITAGAQGDHRTEPYHIVDAFKVFTECLK